MDIFLEKKPYKREEFLNEINRYKQTIARIRKVSPYEIRMSMFLVECSKLNEELVLTCERMITKILTKIEHFVFTESAANVHTNVRNMSQKFGEKADTSAALVDSEKFLEDVKGAKRQEIVSQYNDLIEWLVMLYQFPEQEVMEEQIKNVVTAYNQTNKIQTSIETQETQIKTQREEIERRLQAETKQFSDELTNVKLEIDKFKDHISKTKRDEYNKTIQNITLTLVSL